jgi:hypothetical protein
MEHKESDSEKKKSTNIFDMSPEELLEMKLKQMENSDENEETKEEPIKENIPIHEGVKSEKNDSPKEIPTEIKISEMEKEIIPEVPIEKNIVESLQPSTTILEKEPEKIPLVELKKETLFEIETKTQDIFKIPEPEIIPKVEENPFVKELNEITDEYSLIIIPNWSRLVGYLDMGFYVNKNQKVHNIVSDPVIFFARKSARVHTRDGYVYYIFGLGQIHLKFELQNGKYITDRREINTIILQDFVYDFAASGKDVALNDDPFIIFNENIIKIPFDMSSKTPTQKTFISGIIMRNAFIPNKDIILEMMDNVRKSGSNYSFGTTGLLMLSLTSAHYNELLVSDQTSMKKEYMTTTALISRIISKSDKILDETFTDDEKSIIKNGIIENYNRLGTIQYDPANFMTIFENLASIYKLEIQPAEYTGAINPNTNMTKKLVLESSRDTIRTFVTWPKQFPRNLGWPTSIAEAKGKPKTIFNKDLMIEKAYQATTADTNTNVDLSEYKSVETDDGEKFELRNAQNPTVKHKDLPKVPEIADNEKNLKKVPELLLFMKTIAEQDYEMCEVGRACELVRDEIRKVVRQSDYIWELSKFANQFIKQPSGFGLSLKDKNRVIDRMKYFVNIVENEIKIQEIKAQEERDSLERERIEREKVERERLELERREREKIELERRDKERKDQEIQERERLERERIEREKDELHRKKLQEIKAQQDAERLEAEKRKQQEEMQRLKKEQANMKNRIKEDKKKQKEEQKRQKQLEKEKNKLEKLEKQKKKLEKK